MPTLRRWTAVFVAAAAVIVAACERDDAADATATPDAAATAERDAPFTIADVGLETPESVLDDDAADVYIVSNINGAPAGRDGNGFISRIRPDGDVEQLRWIDGAAAGITLHAPKGMALKGDTLFVADIDTVRAFHRTTGAALGAFGVPGASFLNDVAAGPDGAIYVTDTGVDAAFEPTGTDAIYRFDNGVATPVATGAQLSLPNGIVVEGDELFMVPFGGNTIMRMPARGGAPTTVATLPAGQLDGVIRLGDGTLLVSSWEGSAVYRVATDGQVSAVLENVEAPADIGWDSRRNRVLVPLFMGNAIEVREIR
jgi:hypothetical protein